MIANEAKKNLNSYSNTAFVRSRSVFVHAVPLPYELHNPKADPARPSQTQPYPARPVRPSQTQPDPVRPSQTQPDPARPSKTRLDFCHKTRQTFVTDLTEKGPPLRGVLSPAPPPSPGALRGLEGGRGIGGTGRVMGTGGGTGP